MLFTSLLIGRTPKATPEQRTEGRPAVEADPRRERHRRRQNATLGVHGESQRQAEQERYIVRKSVQVATSRAVIGNVLRVTH